MSTKTNPAIDAEVCRQAKNALYTADMWLSIDEENVRFARKPLSQTLHRYQARLIVSKAQQSLYARLIRKYCSGGEDGDSQ